MTTFVSRNTRVFLEAPKIEVTSVRSESRMKKYKSAIDIRAWCDIVEHRRQHILEYHSKGRTGLCPGTLVPVETLISILMSSKEGETKELKKKIEYYEELIKIYDSLLTPEQKAKLEELKKELDAKYGEGDDVCKAPCATGTQTSTTSAAQGAGGAAGEECDDKCSCDDLPGGGGGAGTGGTVCAENKCTGPCSGTGQGGECNAPCATNNKPSAGKVDCPADNIPAACECSANQGKPSYVCKGPCAQD